MVQASPSCHRYIKPVCCGLSRLSNRDTPTPGTNAQLRREAASIDIIFNVKNNPPMQTLGLSNPEPRSEGRFKSLFWPTIKTADDVDYLGTQGFWVCTLVAALSFVVGVLSGHALIGIVVLLFFYWAASACANTAFMLRLSCWPCTSWTR